MNQQIEKVNQYYNATTFDYHFLWTGKNDLAIHFGYYDDKTTSHGSSLLKMNRVMAKSAEITDKDQVLDAGCGYGGSSVWLAKNMKCKVTGINVVPFQLKKAKQFAQQQKVAGLVSFHIEDYTHTSFPDMSFDVVWALESVVHASDKPEVITEFARLLRPGGRLVMAEYTVRENPPLSNEERDSIRAWLDGWAMPNLLTASGYKKLFEKSGFAHVATHNITPHVMPSLKKLRRWAYVGLPIGRFFHALGIFSDTHLGNIEGVKTQMESLEKGLWQYSILIAKKLRSE